MSAFLWGHWYPCFGLLMTTPVSLKARVGSLICTCWSMHVTLNITRVSPNNLSYYFLTRLPLRLEGIEVNFEEHSKFSCLELFRDFSLRLHKLPSCQISDEYRKLRQDGTNLSEDVTERRSRVRMRSHLLPLVGPVAIVTVKWLQNSNIGNNHGF